MHRLNEVVISLFAVGSLAVAACNKNQEQTEPPMDSSMSDAPGQTQPTVEPTPTEPPPEEPAATKPEPPKQLADNDKTFVEHAAKGGMAEVELSKLALEKAKKQTVKDFAQKMIDDHGKANEELTTLARSKNAEVPAEMDPAAVEKKATLEKLTGSKFEKQYVTIMLDDHKKAVELFREQSTGGTDPELKDWAAKTLPKLEEHLAHVEAMKAGKPYKPKNAAQASADHAGHEPASSAPAK